MHLQRRDVLWLSLLSVCLLLGAVIFGYLPYQQQRSIQGLLSTQQIERAREQIVRLDKRKKALYEGYLAYLEQQPDQALALRSAVLQSANKPPVKLLYNLWTLEALQALNSQPDLTGLQLAAAHLQGELEHSPDDTFAQHNLDVIKQLLGEQAPQQQQNQQEQSWSWEDEQESPSPWQGGAGGGLEEGSQPSSALSEQQRQQLQQYQEYIQQQQAQNQQFFWKEQPPTNSGDPFDVFDMFFGQQQLQQNVQQTDKDW